MIGISAQYSLNSVIFATFCRISLTSSFISASIENSENVSIPYSQRVRAIRILNRQKSSIVCYKKIYALPVIFSFVINIFTQTCSLCMMNKSDMSTNELSNSNQLIRIFSKSNFKSTLLS